ncbi:hypothetical protein D9M69_601490 [compost metagenome]
MHAPGIGVRALDAVHGQAHAQDLQRGELLVERRRFRYIGQVLARLGAVGVDTVQTHLALVVVDDVEHHLDGGGLAGAVGPDETEHLALLQTEADLAQRLHLAALDLEGLAHVPELQRRAQG